MKKYFLGIDSGTTSIKAVLFDLEGIEIDRHALSLTGIFPEENQYEEDMHEIWEKAKACIKAVTSRHADVNISGIGITAQGDGLWLVDENGEPVRNGACFCDGRAADIVDRWVADGTCGKIFELSGTRIFTGNQNCIVKWMDENDKQSLDKARYFLHLKDYLFYKLTGKMTTDATDQSLVLIDQCSRGYKDELFELCGMEEYRDKYPPILPAKENAARLQSQCIEELGLSEETLVTSGPMDVVACALGSGVIGEGECCSIIGTAALHEMVISKPLQDQILAGMTVTHAPQGRWLRLMASLAGTPNLEWFLDTMGQSVKQEAMKKGKNVYTYLEELIDGVPLGANGVMYHPYLLAGGERAPFTDPRARASYTGISVRNTLADIARATYEGVAFAMLDCYRNMALPVKKLTVCGGGAKSAVWCQMFADVLGVEIVTVKGEELGAKGAIINNVVVQGLYPTYEEAIIKMVKPDKTYLPDMERHGAYQKLYDLYLLTYSQLRDTWKLRAELLNL